MELNFNRTVPGGTKSSLKFFREMTLNRRQSFKNEWQLPFISTLLLWI